MTDSEIDSGKINDLIYEIGEKNVLIDYDLAKLYDIALEDISDTVQNNLERFPKRFSWVLSNNEMRQIRSRATGLSPEQSTKNPRVFTEQGAAILTTVLKTDAATKVSLGIMDAFVTMSKYLSDELVAKSPMDDRVEQNAADIARLKAAFQKMTSHQLKNEIFFEGQVYDAYAKISEIFNSAQSSLIIIDNYADITVLDIVKRLPNVKVSLITKANNLLTKQDIKKYNLQYHNVDVYYNESFHDRYFIIDDSTVYHCGSSLNRIGNKTFSINRINDADIIRLLKAQVEHIFAHSDKAST